MELIPECCDTVIFLEEGIENGGAAQCLFEKLRHYPEMKDKRYLVRAIDDDFIYGEKGRSHWQSAHLTAEDIIESYISKNNI